MFFSCDVLVAVIKGTEDPICGLGSQHYLNELCALYRVFCVLDPEHDTHTFNL